jgi:hypothetical protein
VDRQLIDYLPHIIRDVREYKAILNHGEQAEVSFFWNATDAVFDDQFIESSTVNGIKRWEKILGLVPKGTDTLQTRKTKILIELNAQSLYTFRAFKNMLSSLFGDNFELNTDFTEYEMELTTHIGEIGEVDNLKYLIQSIIPANLIVISTNTLECHANGQARIGSAIIPTMIYTVTNDFETVISANGSVFNKSAAVVVTEYQI